MTRTRCAASLFSAWLLLSACGGQDGGAPLDQGPQAEPGEELSGGETTVFDTSTNAYSLSARNMPPERRSAFFVGNSFFKENWVIAPSSTEGRDGLGPLFNARSCSSCHFMDGRGSPPTSEDESLLSVLIRLSIPGENKHGGPVDEPTYGDQLQPKAIPTVEPEGTPYVSYEEVPGTFADGEAYSLRRPTYTIEGLSHGAMHPDVMLSPRVAPAMTGMGLLEAISEEDLLAAADPDDLDGDGISGRTNHVWDVQRGAKAIGRFGWKANQPTVAQQTAAAFLGDIGITSSMFPGENCSAAELDCAAAPSGGSPDVSPLILERVAFYSSTLAVPGRRGWDDAAVLRGKEHFRAAGCARCHTPMHETGELADFPELSHQTIRPYTDLLLHDMGEALADGRPDFEASGQEWRTPPLWGIGLQHVVNKHTTLLHDGRARDAVEAVLWHGGEAEASREAFRAMPKAERDELIRFLESL